MRRVSRDTTHVFDERVSAWLGTRIKYSLAKSGAYDKPIAVFMTLIAQEPGVGGVCDEL